MHMRIIHLNPRICHSTPGNKYIVTILCHLMPESPAQCSCSIAIHRAVSMGAISHLHVRPPAQIHLCGYRILQLNLNPAGAQHGAQSQYPYTSHRFQADHKTRRSIHRPVHAILTNQKRQFNPFDEIPQHKSAFTVNGKAKRRNGEERHPSFPHSCGPLCHLFNRDSHYFAQPRAFIRVQMRGAKHTRASEPLPSPSK